MQIKKTGMHENLHSEPKIFISYCDLDRKKLRILQQLIVDTDFLSPVIIADRRSALELLSEKVANGIKECKYFVPIITSNAIQNQWVNQEIGFATALNRIIKPIIQDNLVSEDKLKGFIHKQADLPYRYDANHHSEVVISRRFKKYAQQLVNDILADFGKLPVTTNFESFFAGKWKCEFVFAGKKGSEEFQIQDGVKYFVRDKHYFDIKDFRFDKKNKKLSFTKHQPSFDGRVLYNQLEIIEIGKEYKGFEGPSPIRYTRIA